MGRGRVVASAVAVVAFVAVLVVAAFHDARSYHPAQVAEALRAQGLDIQEVRRDGNAEARLAARASCHATGRSRSSCTEPTTKLAMRFARTITDTEGSTRSSCAQEPSSSSLTSRTPTSHSRRRHSIASVAP